jgi:hypothetical protein
VQFGDQFIWFHRLNLTRAPGQRLSKPENF